MIFQALYECLDASGCLLLALAALLLTDVVRNWRPGTFPPGPLALPFFGNVFTAMDYLALESVSFFGGAANALLLNRLIHFYSARQEVRPLVQLEARQ